jgi:menaquinone-dependent protoporphyrinogen oxidase
MRKIAVVYSSWHGHVRDIAARLETITAVRGWTTRVIDARTARLQKLTDCDAAVIVGSVHFARHSRALRRFVQDKKIWIATVPSAFLSVSGAAISLDGREKALEYITDFLHVTGWKPDVILPVAGAVAFTRYDPLTRMMMKFSSRTAGRECDTSRDYVYTNWLQVDQFMHQFVDTLERYERAPRDPVLAQL